jgi:hypothetical protein
VVSRIRIARRPRTWRRGGLRAGAAAALPFTLGAPAVAGASGSIAFIKDNNVWLTTHDG